MTFEQIIERFDARRVGSDYMAHCRVATHGKGRGDKNPSVCISKGEDSALLHCHAGCSAEDVCRAAGMTVRDLYFDNDSSPRIVNSYGYTDEHGALLYQVVRFEPKGFRQRRPGHGGWIWNLDGVRRVLYQLPEVMAASDVISCEGEKDVETVRKLGLVATCNAGGAGKWREEYDDSLRGKRVVIVADADEPGRKHAHQVAASIAGKAASVKVVELPSAKDLSEWVERGGTRDALLELIRNAPEWKLAKNAHASGFTLTPLGELLAKPDVPVDYVLENRLVAGTVSMVAAKPKVGKSTLARNLCLAIAGGKSFLGMATKKGECIYLALEEREEEVRSDFRAMGADGSELILIHAATAPAEGILALCDLIRERRPRLVVVDPLFRIARVRDEKAYAEIYAALGPLIDAARETGTHVMLLHHAGKSMKSDAIDSPLGSTALGGVVSTICVMKKTEAYRTVQSVQRIGQDMPETVLQYDTHTRRLSVGGTRYDAELKECEGAILEFIAGAGEPQTQAQIRENVDGQTKVVRAALTTLFQEKRVLKTSEGTRGKPFLYGFPNSGSQHISGTSKPESRNGLETRINSGDKVVPEFSPDSILVPENLRTPEGAFLDPENSPSEDDGEVRL